MYDLIIIGGSAAGASAAIYAARRKLNFKIITMDLGGEVALSGEVNNWPGIISIQGFDLAQKFSEHVKSYGVNIEEGWDVTEVSRVKKHLVVKAKNSAGQERVSEAKTVIITTGIHPRRLTVPGDIELDRKGVTYCTVCDGPLFKDKITATIGSGNSALESALMMADIAKKVFLVSKFSNDPKLNGGFPRGENILVDKVKQLPKIEVIYSANTMEILGKEKVTGLKYKDSQGRIQELAVDGIMVHIGQIPNSQLVKKVKKNKGDEIIVDEKCRTNIAGMFAAGDVTDVAYKQIGIAAGQGIIAALAAIEYINLWTE